MSETESDSCLHTKYQYGEVVTVWNNAAKKRDEIREINRRLDILYGKAPAHCNCSRCRTY